MKTVDRYLTRELIPAWVWVIVVFILVGCVIDLFEHLDEILRYRIPAETVLTYYLNFMPIVFVQASPLALLVATAFVTTRLVRHQELLAMNAGGMSMAQAIVPFAFVGWLVSLGAFAVNEALVPTTTAVYESMRQEVFGGNRQNDQTLQNVAILDESNRLYHARELDLKKQELADLTVLEHDQYNRPKRTIYARQAISTPSGWLLVYGNVTRLGARGALVGDPEPFVERLMPFPVTVESFRQPHVRPEMLRMGQLRRLMDNLQALGITNVRPYAVELAAKVSFPLMNLIICLIGFLGSIQQRQARGHLKGIGASLGWGVLYYLAVAFGQGVGKQGMVPVWLAVWLPHALALAACLWVIRRSG